MIKLTQVTSDNSQAVILLYKNSDLLSHYSISSHTSVVSNMDNYVGRLQEMCQTRVLPLPEYHVARASGESHNPTFTMQVTCMGKTAEGSAGNKVI